MTQIKDAENPFEDLVPAQELGERERGSIHREVLHVEHGLELALDQHLVDLLEMV